MPWARVVDHDREVVGGRAVVAAHDEVVDDALVRARAGGRERRPARRRRARRSAGGRPPRALAAPLAVGQVQAGAGVGALGQRPVRRRRRRADLRAGAEALVHAPGGVERGDRRRVGVRAAPTGRRPRRPSRARSPRGRRAARSPRPRARGRCRGPPCARGSARRPSGRTATPAGPCAGCRGAACRSGSARSGRRRSRREGEPVGDVGQPRGVAVALGEEQLDVRATRCRRRGRRSGCPPRWPGRSSSCTCRRSRPLGEHAEAVPEADRDPQLVRRGSSSSSSASHSPKVGEPRRRSTTTSSTRPRAQRTSLPWPGSVWKWMPRSVPRREREWLSCTKAVGDAVLAPTRRRGRSPRRSRARRRARAGASRTRPSSLVGRRCIEPAG